MACRGSPPASDCPRGPLAGVLRGARAPRSWSRLQQVPHPDEVVRRGPEEEDPVHQGGAPVVELPELPDGLQPPEDLLDAFAAPLTDGVPGVTGRAAVNGTRAARSAVLGDMGRDLQLPATGHEVRRVVALVPAQGGAVVAGDRRGDGQRGSGL